jgi:hypothetical protein
MEKVERSPAASCSRRRMRTQAEWKVDTHMRSPTGPMSAATLSRISAAALLVKVMARISPGRARRVAMRWAMRRVRTRVLPDPAPAMMSRGEPEWVTARLWAGLRSRVSSSGSTAVGAAP